MTWPNRRPAILLADTADGRVIVAGPGAVRVGDLIDGIASVRTGMTLREGAVLASSFARVLPLSPLLAPGRDDAAVAVAVRGFEGDLAAFEIEPAIVTDADLVAVGAAVAPLSYWYHRVVRVVDAADVDRALRGGEGTARMNLVASGADPDDVRITESRVLGTTYGDAQVVRLRVRGVAPTPDVPLPDAPEHTMRRTA